MAVSCPTNKNFKDLVQSIKDWSEQDINKRYFSDAYTAAFKVAESEFNGISIDWLRHNPELSAGQVGSFKARLRELTNNIRRGTIESNFAELFFRTGTGFAKKDPVIGDLLRNMQKSGFAFRANEVRDKTLFKDLLKSLATQSKLNTKSRTGIPLKQAQKEIDALDLKYREALNDFSNGDRTSTDKILKIKNEMDGLIASSHLKVYDDMLGLLEGKSREQDGKTVWEYGIPKLLQDKYFSLSKSKRNEINEGRILKLSKQDLAKLKMPDGSDIPNNMYNAITSYMNLMDGLYSTLRSGVRKVLDTRRVKLEKDGHSSAMIKATMKKLEDKLMPKYEQGYFPHYTRDLNASLMDGLMPHFENLQNTTNYSKKGKKNIEQVLEEINSYVDGHVTGRSEDYDYSRNFVNSISNYISDVNRFNFSSFMDGHIVESLVNVEKIYKSKGDARGYSDSLVSFIESMHMAANGSTEVSRNTRAMMKTLLGFEFISKLGFNPRGAARNFTQRLLDHVHWGPVQINKANKYLEKMPFEQGDSEYYIEKALRESGLLFEEASPEFMQSGLDAPASMFKQREWNDSTGKYEVIKKTRLESFADSVQTAAGKSSFMHRAAENANRKHTFKIGFAQMHSWLNTSEVRRSMEKQRIESGKYKKRIDEGKSVLTEAEFQNTIRKQSKNYAINMVVMNHFDYADYAKSRAARSNLGRFMLQFQHYSFEFFERNMQILREAKHDVATGNLLESLKFFVPGTGKSNAHGLEKAYRMGIAYFLAPTLVSMAFGVNVGNIVEHDTAERIKQWFTYFTGDDDEIAAAFYGKGPLLGTVGGPLISDAIDIGVMLDLIDLDDESLLTLIAGMEEHDPSTSTELGSKLRILNTFAARAYERHYPAIAGGKIGFALQQELALYPTPEARKRVRSKRKEEKRKKKLMKQQNKSSIDDSLSLLAKEGRTLLA